MSRMRVLAFVVLAVLLLFVVPIATHALWWTYGGQRPSSFRAADWSSAGLLPRDARSHPDALVRVYAARTGRWRGIFAHHSWIVVKEAGASAYTRFDKVGWGSPVRVNGWAADGRWFSNEPELVLALDGAQAQAAIPAIRAAVERYPHARHGDYRAWPGPNSNTFVSYVLGEAARDSAALAVALPPTALGKDFSPTGRYAGPGASGTGLRLSLANWAGVTLGPVEGLEIHLFGFVFGIDPFRPALKLPGWGRLGLPPMAATAHAETL